MPGETLIDRLSVLPQRETGGSTATNRFRYQHHWAIMLMLEQLEQDVDFLLLCEHHEDVLLLWPADDPVMYSIFQIKTRESASSRWRWTASRLCERKKGRKGPTGSPLGKLVGTMRLLGTADLAKAVLSSNRPYMLCRTPKNTPTEHRALYLSEVAGKCLEKIDSCLSRELDCPPTGMECAKLYLETSQLNVATHEQQLRAKLSEYVEMNYGSDALNAGPLLRALQAEVARCSSHEWTHENAQDLREKKAITRGDFVAWCSRARAPRQAFSSWWILADIELARLDIPVLRRRELKVAARDVAVRRAAADEYPVIRDDEKRVRKYVAENVALNIGEMLENVKACTAAIGLDAPGLAQGMLLNLVFDDEQELQSSDKSTQAEDL